MGNERVLAALSRCLTLASSCGLSIDIGDLLIVEFAVFSLQELLFKDGVFRLLSFDTAFFGTHVSLEASHAVLSAVCVRNALVVDTAQELVYVVLDVGVLVSLVP